VPALLAALDLSVSAQPERAATGSARLQEFARDLTPDWRQRPPRRRPVRPSVPNGGVAATHAPRKQSRIADELWDDRAEADAEQMLGLLFVAAEPLKRSEIAEALRLSPARLAGVRSAAGGSAARAATGGFGRSADVGLGASPPGNH
jgi:hypothetical protein